MHTKIILLILQLLSSTVLYDNDNRTFLNKTNIIPNNWEYTSLKNYNDKIHYFILLKQENVDILEKELIDRSNPKSNNYGNWLSKNEIDSIVFTKRNNMNVVKRWLVNNNNYNCYENVDSLYCSSYIKNVETLFNTKMKMYRNNKTNKIIYSGREYGYSIPSYLNGIIDLVLGIVDFPENRNELKLKPSLEDNINYTAPITIRKLYNMSKYHFNNVSSQAVAEFQGDNCFNLDNLNGFTKDNNLEKVNIESKNIWGDCNTSSPYPDTEATLDIQYQVGVNDNAKQMYVSVSEWMYQFASLLYNSSNPPLVNSMSWGWAERQQCSQPVFPQCSIGGDAEVYTKRTNIEFMKLGLRGVSLIASSGDAGAPGRTNEPCIGNHLLNPAFPASSPWVLTVGGTMISNPKIYKEDDIELCKKNRCIIGGEEMNCNYNNVQWTAGGGFSNYFERPWWQVNTSESYLHSKTKFPPKKLFNRKGRVYPDLSLIAHNFLINMGNFYGGVDGTSASSPSVSGMIGILNNLRLSQKKPSLGPVGPLLYQMYNECKDCFKDLVIGSNNSTEYGNCKYGYWATKGYDAVYGLGLPNFDKIYHYIEKMSN